MSKKIEQKIFEALLEPVFLIDSEKKVLYCNEAAATICDLSLRKIQRAQLTLDQIFNFQEPVQCLNELKTVSESTPYQEIAFQTHSRKAGKIQITLQAFDSNEHQASWLVYFRDVTLEETLQSKYRTELDQKEHVINDLRSAQAELKNYSENLEKMVVDRTLEISKLNQTMAALLDSLSQGFLLFDKQGDCLDVYSKACLNTIQTVPVGKKIWEVLGLKEKETPGFQKWMKAVYAEMLPFEDLAPLAPQTFPNSEGKYIQLEYYPLKNKENVTVGIVVVASDLTQLIEAKNIAESERAHAKMILHLVKNKFQFESFLREAQEILQKLNEVSQTDPFDADGEFRLLHTLKGGAAMFSIKSVVELCHSTETALTEWKADPIDTKFENLKDLSEKVSLQFSQFLKDNQDIIGTPEKSKQRRVELSAQALQSFISSSQMPQAQKNKFTEEFLMEPVRHFVAHYNEVIQQISHSEGKSVFPLEINNTSIKLLPEHYEQLFSTLIHAYRNAVDHGIETPEARESLGKNPTGKIQTTFILENSHDGEWLRIEIKDDGSGISPEKIRARLTAKNISCAQESDFEVIQHVFDSQFSTKEMITQTSGRGVGMDAILFAAKQLGGTAWVDSTVGQGSTLTVRVPYLSQTSLLSKVS